MQKRKGFRRDASKANVGLERLQKQSKQPTDVYYYHPRQNIVNSSQDKFQLVEFITDLDHDILLAAPLSKLDMETFGQEYEINTHLSISEHNRLLNTLLSVSGNSKMIFTIVKVGNGNTSVVVPPDIELPTSGKKQITAKIVLQQYKSIDDGALNL